MIEEAVLEEGRKGNFHRVFPCADYTTVYKNFFEEERPNDTILYDYIFVKKYKNATLIVPKRNLPSAPRLPKSATGSKMSIHRQKQLETFISE